MAIEVSRVSTPLSPTSTLSVPASPHLKPTTADIVSQLSNSPLFPASSHIELLASRSSTSSGVFIYDLAEQVGFGTLTKAWSHSNQNVAPVISLQTRSGAGLTLVGRLSQGTSTDAAKGSVFTAYTTPTGLAAMADSLSELPPPMPTSRLVIQVPNVTPVGEDFALSPSLAHFNPAVSILPNGLSIILSSSAKESVDLAALSYQINTHVIHIFDHYSASREIGHSFDPISEADSDFHLHDALRRAGYALFDYVGDRQAHTVLVLLNGPLASSAKAIVSKVPNLGVIVVRVLRPWDEPAFLEMLPDTVKTVHVFDDIPSESSQGVLYTDVLGSLLGTGPVVKAHRLVPTRTQEFILSPSVFESYVLGLAPSLIATAATGSPVAKNLVFFSTPGSTLSALPLIIEQAFLASNAISSYHLTNHDLLSRPRGTTVDSITLSLKGDSPLIRPQRADFLVVLDEALLKSHAVLEYAKRGSPVLVVTSWTAEELLSNLPQEATILINESDLQICTFDAVGLFEGSPGVTANFKDFMQTTLVYFAFLRLYLGEAAKENRIEQLVRKSALGELLKEVDLTKVGGRAWSGLRRIVIPRPGLTEAVELQESSPPLKDFSFNAIAVETEEGETIVNGAKLGSWHDAAKHILFPSVFTPPYSLSTDEYPQNPCLHPELPDRTFLVTCAVNKRLTPTDYDRNVFHLEFDTTGTSLKYEIGEALGVHGWNDEQDVLDFCSWYGVSPDRLITIPIPGVDGKVHTRTIFQALQQQIDLFGKPPKSFFTDLAAYATDKLDKLALQFIGSAEGSSTLKKLSEKETVTFADILRRYESARPGIEVLCELVGDTKPRHYSIASAQAVVGDRVDLLVVTVDWVTPSGDTRYGQCTRYLAGLKVGQKVTVSVKPSVMKLPADSTRPLILAGLGTGAAPFRAFLQYRALQVEQNIPVGPIYYYFGSRHQSQEYLYGEELEAYVMSGIITKAGFAFSRDGPKKVYIQHKMAEDGSTLVKALHEKEGAFYLCGPTWPVPDVYEALVNSLVANNFAPDAKVAGDYLESLKGEERYVLEVY